MLIFCNSRYHVRDGGVRRHGVASISWAVELSAVKNFQRIYVGWLRPSWLLNLWCRAWRFDLHVALLRRQRACSKCYSSREDCLLFADSNPSRTAAASWSGHCHVINPGRPGVGGPASNLRSHISRFQTLGFKVGHLRPVVGCKRSLRDLFGN